MITLPAWHLLTGWLMTLAVVACGIAIFFVTITSGTRIGARRRVANEDRVWRGLSVSVAVLLLVLASRVYLGRFDYLLTDHTIFAGVTYTEAHVTLTGLLIV